MPTKHKIEQGESLSLLSKKYGLSAETIWKHPDNAKLRAERARMDVLLPGDELTIPDINPKTVQRPTGDLHRFRLRGSPILFELQVFNWQGKLLDKMDYVLEVDGVEHRGKTDDKGYLRHNIPNESQRGRLFIKDEVDRVVLFGHLDPIETIPGVQKRLTNIGFACAHEEGQMGRATLLAIRSFQSLCGLKVTGKIDDETREEIRACHDDRERLRKHLERPPTIKF